jgi:hypothetical protein
MEEELYPMENLSLVAPGVYRSAFPIRRNFPFLKKLGLKAILTLILEEYPEQNMKFLQENGIHLFQFGVAGNKEPFVDIPEDKVHWWWHTSEKLKFEYSIKINVDLCCFNCSARQEEPSDPHSLQQGQAQDGVSRGLSPKGHALELHVHL